jgi:ribonuclease BN (tRNA processing enzyme)
MKIKILGAHNTESRTTKLMSLLIDDILALDAGGLTSSLSFEDQSKIKAVLLTHHHYDHIRDIPALAINLFFQNKTVDIYTHQIVYDVLTRHLLNGEVYPEYHKRPEENPTLKFHILEHHQKETVEGYNILPLQVIHSIPAMGYQITSRDGKTIFYTGDTGPDLSEIWEHIFPQFMFIEVTASNQWTDFSRKAGHLSPELLKEVLIQFRAAKGYLPRVVAVHLNPSNEIDIKPQIAAVAKSLGADIRLAKEGMLVEL